MGGRHGRRSSKGTTTIGRFESCLISTREFCHVNGGISRTLIGREPGHFLPLAANTSAVGEKEAIESSMRMILGLSRGITDGIGFAHQQGIVTSTSYMVNQPASDYAG